MYQGGSHLCNRTICVVVLIDFGLWIAILLCDSMNWVLIVCMWSSVSIMYVLFKCFEMCEELSWWVAFAKGIAGRFKVWLDALKTTQWWTGPFQPYCSAEWIVVMIWWVSGTDQNQTCGRLWSLPRLLSEVSWHYSIKRGFPVLYGSPSRCILNHAHQVGSLKSGRPQWGG